MEFLNGYRIVYIIHNSPGVKRVLIPSIQKAMGICKSKMQED